MSSHHGASLVAAAVRAAILAKAPRRTVAAVAAAMASALHKPAAQSPPPGAREQAGAQTDTPVELPGASLEVLVEATRTARAEQRRKKKERRRANRSARGSTGKEEGQALSTDALRRHDVSTAGANLGPGGGGTDEPSRGSCEQRPPKLQRTADEAEATDSVPKCLPPVPVFSPAEMQVAAVREQDADSEAIYSDLSSIRGSSAQSGEWYCHLCGVLREPEHMLCMGPACHVAAVRRSAEPRGAASLQRRQQRLQQPRRRRSRKRK